MGVVLQVMRAACRMLGKQCTVRLAGPSFRCVLLVDAAQRGYSPTSRRHRTLSSKPPRSPTCCCLCFHPNPQCRSTRPAATRRRPLALGAVHLLLPCAYTLLPVIPSTSAMQEYAASGDKEEVRRILRDLAVPFFHHEFVKQASGS